MLRTCRQPSRFSRLMTSRLLIASIILIIHTMASSTTKFHIKMLVRPECLGDTNELIALLGPTAHHCHALPFILAINLQGKPPASPRLLIRTRHAILAEMTDNNPPGTLLGYWVALIGAAIITTCLFGPPLASCYKRSAVLEGNYQVAAFPVVFIMGISLHAEVPPFTASAPFVGWFSHRVLIDSKRLRPYGRTSLSRISRPSVGELAYHALPCISYSPKPLGLNFRTGP